VCTRADLVEAADRDDADGNQLGYGGDVLEARGPRHAPDVDGPQNH